MHASAIFLGLAATAVSGLDIRLYYAANCAGEIIVSCVDAEPNRCCGISWEAFSSVGFAPVPSNWWLDYRAHAGPNCGAVRDGTRRSGVTSMCIVKGPFAGGGYSFVSKKRGSENGECQKPNLLTIGGTDIAIGDLSEAQQLQIFELAKAGTNVTTVQEKITSFV